MSSADPIPLDAAQRAQTEAMTAAIVAEIEAHGGWLRFDRYMEMALYEPGLGYYSGGAVKLGPAGDFTTAPELSPALADALAAYLAPLLGDLASPTVLELGAGTGRLAAQLIARLGHVPDLAYRILEPSPDLRARQQTLLAESRVAPPVEWLDALPEKPFDGVVIGNEVADALPVVVFEKSGGRALPFGVAVRDGALVWQLGDEDAAVSAAVAALEAALGRPLPDGFRSELCLLLPPWIAALGRSIGRGGILLIDYGLPAGAYYHADRHGGTLICHFRHRAHADPFLLPGLQDITAWVDFSTAARAGRAAGLRLSGFTTQGQFLAESLAASGSAALDGLSAEALSTLKTLLLPGEMGERFKLLWLTCGIDPPSLPGRDFRDRLE